MIALLLFSAIVGMFVAGVAGPIFGVIAGVALFVCGVPFALISDFVHDSISYAADRADYRSMIEELNEDAREIERAEREDRGPSVFNDNRQVHIHGRWTAP
jgi:hypothetical protein